MENPTCTHGDCQLIECCGDNDHFSKCPDDIKLEILSYLHEPTILSALCKVSKEWCDVVYTDCTWKDMFLRDFMWWDKRREIKLTEEQTWRALYKEYYLKGWQWDPTQVNQKIELSNNNFTACLSSGYTYHGIRTTRGEERGVHYFEVLVEHFEDDKKFNKGTTIFMGVGISNERFNVENCCSGWTRDNCGVGYYNDGQIYAFSDRYYGKNSKIAYQTGDRVGVEFDLDKGIVVFYLNGSPVTDPIGGVHGKIYPHLILANDIKQRVSITTGRRSYSPSTSASMVTEVYSEALIVLESMGFVNRECCTDLLVRYGGDVEKVVNELLAS